MFSMHHELLRFIHSALHSKEMLEYRGASGLLKSSRDLLDQFLFHRNACLNEKFSECGSLSKFDTCFYEGCE